MKIAPLAGHKSAKLGQEISAGITLLAISLPLNIGYSQIAGLPASAGLVALIFPTLVYVLLASSRVVIASPDAAASALVFSSLVGLHVGEDNMLAVAGAQAIVCGIALAVAGFLKLGFLASYLSKPIMMGFVAGLALEILLSQVFKMTGVSKGEGDGFFAEAWHFISHIVDSNGATVILAALSLAVLIAGKRLAPKIPWALVVLILGTVAVSIFGLAAKGISVLGPVESASLSLALPLISLDMWLALIPSGIALAFVVLADALMLTKSYADKYKVDHDGNQDLIALAASNITAGVSGSFVQGASASRTAAVTSVGARTQIPSIVLAVGALIVVLFGLELLENIPNAVIGAIVAMAVWGLLEIHEFRKLFTLSRAEFAVAVVCVIGVLALGPLKGLFVAFVLASINLIRNVSKAPADILEGEEDPAVSLLDAEQPEGISTAPGVQVFRFTGPLFFANAERFVECAQQAVKGVDAKTLILDAEGISDLDVTGAEALEQLQAWLEHEGITFGMSRVRADLVRRLEHFELLEDVTLYETNRAAVAATRTDHAD